MMLQVLALNADADAGSGDVFVVAAWLVVGAVFYLLPTVPEHAVTEPNTVISARQPGTVERA